MDDLAARLVTGHPEHLDPFSAHLAQERTKERRKLVRGLRSQRFAKLLDEWRAELTAVLDSAHDESATVHDLAADRLGHATGRVVKRARRITPETPDDDVHELRKKCKELRYLLEVFAPVCEPAGHKVVVKDLKRVQDVLGRFQDGSVQCAALREFAGAMVDSGQAPVDTLLAMGELAAQLDAVQREARAELANHLAPFTDPKLQKRVCGLVR